MPTYLCHGFRWKRRSIRVYVVIQNLDDAAPEWLIKRGSARSLVESFYNLFDFLPPARPSSPEPLPCLSGFTDRSSVVDDDGTSDHHTTRTCPSRGRGQGAAAQRNQGPFHHGRGSLPRPSSRRESSNSSRKRSKPETSLNPLPLSAHYPSVSQTYHSPPSPPLSQPQFPSPSHKSLGNGLDPVLTQDWSPVKLLEEYDPNNLEEVSRPYAYVADYVQRIDSSCSVAEEIAKYEQQVHFEPDPAIKGPKGGWDTSKRPGWLGQLRDQLQRDEEIKWYVVVNGDEERAWPVDGAGSKPETRAQTVHHERHTHQQTVFEDQDRDIETRRQELRRELGYEESGIGSSVDGTLETRPEVPETESTELPPDSPVPPAVAPRAKTPKMPVKTFRRFFGRSKTGDTS
ncbi:hypothetical protein VM1G_04189 [Cytospora mali]|uniref:Developmental regulator protein n=1 Tax=Cytospora mali TaxID=578113 RepID=A0A194VWG4_CYTMA|nr:hypothetical protein VM1G_04189 [Valsa mali]